MMRKEAERNGVKKIANAEQNGGVRWGGVGRYELKAEQKTKKGEEEAGIEDKNGKNIHKIGIK